MNYKWQEVICPFCKKGFTTMIYEEYDLQVKHDEKELRGWISKCPKCMKEVFAVEGSREGQDPSSYPEEAITWNWILR